MKLGNALLILGGLALVGLAVWWILLKPAPAPAGDSRPWYEKGLDAIAPDRLKFGYAGFGLDLAF